MADRLNNFDIIYYIYIIYLYDVQIPWDLCFQHMRRVKPCYITETSRHLRHAVTAPKQQEDCKDQDLRKHGGC